VRQGDKISARRLRELLWFVGFSEKKREELISLLIMMDASLSNLIKEFEVFFERLR
jgi:hypothetical protein